MYRRLQQYLPFTVLKQNILLLIISTNFIVATVPTVYGIETVYKDGNKENCCLVATVPTVYGIETKEGKSNTPLAFTLTLQQYLPFTVLKQEYASA